MTDNVSITAGTGTSIATDEVGGAHYQKIKLVDGTADSATAAVVTGAGALLVDGSGATQPVSAAALPLPTGAATEATLAAIDTKLAGTLSAAIAGAVEVTNDAGNPLPVSGTVTANAGAGPWPVTGTVTVEDGGGSLTVDGAVTVSDGGGSVTVDGTVAVSALPALAAGANLVGRVSPEPQTANGLSIARVLSAASTNATSVKAGAGQVYAIYAHNTNAAVRHLKLYDKAAAPTVGTDTPVLTLPIPGNLQGAGFVLDTGGMGIAFASGIALALTTGVADSDTGAVAANEIVVNLLYK
ncbi:MAG: hypothetical protein ACOY3L_03640 [Pseudomonadota bacterium]